MGQNTVEFQRGIFFAEGQDDQRGPAVCPVRSTTILLGYSGFGQSRDLFCHCLFQRNAPGVVLIIPPWKFVWTVARECAGRFHFSKASYFVIASRIFYNAFGKLSITNVLIS